jgi:flagellin-like protein
MKLLRKKAQSQVIASVLLVLIVLVAAAIIMSFVVPFVQKQLSGSGCLDVMGYVQISDNEKYSCYDSSNNAIRVQVHIGDTEELQGVIIELRSADSKSYEIIDNERLEGVSMYSGNNVLELPGRNEERTYLISSETRPDSIAIYPKLKNGKTCESSDLLSNVQICTTIE